MEREFEGIYYPFAIFEDDSLLKKSLLFFDRVNVAIPTRKLLVKCFDKPNEDYLKTALQELDEFLSKTKCLRDAKALITIDLLENEDTALGLFHYLDVFEKEIKSAMPFLVTAATDTSSSLEITVELKKRTAKRISNINKMFHSLTAIRLKAWLIILTRVQYCVPFTNNEQIHESFVRAYERIVKASNLSLAARQSFRLTAAQFGIEVFRSYLPNFEMKSYEDVLELREQLSDSLADFRTEMSRLAAKVASEPWEPGYQRELVRIMKEEIKPSIARLEKQAKGLKHRKRARLVGTLSSTLPLVATVFPGVSLGKALAVAAGIAGYQLLQERKADEVEQNGLSLLFKPALRR